MEVPLLPEREEKKWAVTRRAFVEELKKLSFMAAPRVAVTVSQYLLSAVSEMMTGHLGELSLSSVAIAASFTNVTGFIPLFGFACALETLCGQAYGAEQCQKLGTYAYSAMIFLIPICIPISVLWIFMDKLLVLLGQDAQISVEACNYSSWLIPALPAFAFLRSLVHYLQSQSLIRPMLLSSCATLCLHILVCWALVFKADLRNIGAALSVDLAYWFNAIILALYIRYSSSCKKTRSFTLKDIFSSIKKFFSFALPSAVMIYIERWSCEILILLSGLLPNSKLETSVLSICLTVSSVPYFVPYGIGNAASTRVANELGAGNPQAAQLATYAVMVLAVIETVIVSATIFYCRNVLAYAFSSDRYVVNYVAELAPLLSISIIMDSMQAVLSGVARGTGWQHIGAYYLVGIPAESVLCFILHLRGKDLCIGIMSGITVQVIVLGIITSFTNWQKQAAMARERMFEGKFSADNKSV